MGRLAPGVKPLGPSNFRGVGWTLGVGAWVAGPLGKPDGTAVGGADGIDCGPTGVTNPEATIAGTKLHWGEPKVGVVVSQLRNSREREPKLRYHPTMVTQTNNFAA